MSNNAVDLLFSDYRRAVLALLLPRPDDALHVREIARLTGIPAGSLHRELKALAEAGLLLREPQGNQVRYRANRACPIYPELAAILLKTAGLVDVLAAALSALGDDVKTAFVFGSLAAGTASSASDVDFFVIGAADFAEVVAAVVPLAERLGRTVNPVVMSVAEFARQREAGERFVARVLSEPKLFVKGSDDDLG